MSNAAGSIHYAYLHGFASGPVSRKGTLMQRVFAERGLTLHLLDLNVPSFEKLTFSGSLTAVDEADRSLSRPEDRWRLIGSSMGGYLAARWAALHPERVDRMVLYCPGFGLVDRWQRLVGDEAMERWRREGEILWPDGEGRERPLHWGFVVDARTHPAVPSVPCPTLILHGSKDEIVTIESSRRYAAERDHVGLVELIELDDEHALMGSLDLLVACTLQFFDIAGAH